MYDVRGAEYTISTDNQNQSSSVKRVGDIIDYHNDGIVKWSGLFSQAEYSNGMLSAFLNISGSNSAYKRIDYFRKKDLILSDTTILEALGNTDTLTYNGNNYTFNSSEAQFATTNWKWIRGYTIKTGANLNLDEYNNVLFNTGDISKAPKFSNIDTQSNTLQTYINNEEVKVIEGGYSFRSSSFSANINTIIFGNIASMASSVMHKSL